MSVGGGPGFDFIAVALLSDFLGMESQYGRETLRVDALVLDYELGEYAAYEALHVDALKRCVFTRWFWTTNSACVPCMYALCILGR